MTATSAEPLKDECYRCGYDLRGIANDGACPECGLVAERSRRITDELHDTRPRWLRSLSRGINLIMLAIVAMFAGPIVATIFDSVLAPWGWWNFYIPLAGYDLAAICLFVGVILVTRPEGYAPADRADQRLRKLLRVAAIVPVLAAGLLTAIDWNLNRVWVTEREVDTLMVIFLVLFAFVPLLLFLHLRGLARRAHSAHLAEHCVIVGVGAFASTLDVAAVVVIMNNPQWLRLNPHWQQQPIQLVMLLILSVAGCLFVLWSLYLLVRFAIAFWIASATLRRKWTRDDRSLT